MKILAIPGSLRTNSYNRQLAQAAQNMFAKSHPEVDFEILEWSDVPLFNQDREYLAPEAVNRVRDKVKSADGIWIFTPEYNHSCPGVLKNLLDWLSRPISQNKGQVLAGKPVAFCGASIGASGATHAQEHLIPILSLVNMKIMNSPRLGIPYIAEQTDDAGELELSSSAPYLERQGAAFVRFIENEN